MEACDARLSADRRERVVVRARSAAMHLQRPMRVDIAGQRSKRKVIGGREQLVLKMMDLEADVVLGDLLDAEAAWRTWCTHWLARSGRADVIGTADEEREWRLYSDNWGKCVWQMDIEENQLRRVLDIGTDSSHNTEAIEFVYSYYTGEEPEQYRQSNGAGWSRDSIDAYRLESTALEDTDTKVNKEMCGMISMKVGQINFETDCRCMF